MSRATIDSQAVSAARAAAARAGVEVRPLDGLTEFEAGSRLVSEIWSDEGDTKIPSQLLRALSHAGNFIAGAFTGGSMIGFSIGFFGRESSGLHLHSHITGVRPDVQSKAVGFALKQFQRAWALQRGISVVRWTTDPLVRRNGFFNLGKLGASIVAYHSDFYGRMNDGLNAGEESDRVVVHWDLDSERATAASEGMLDEPHIDDGTVVLAEEDGRPFVHDAKGSTLLAYVPLDIVELRHDDPERARAWRLALRDTFGRAINDGYRADAMTRNGWYILSR